MRSISIIILLFSLLLGSACTKSFLDKTASPSSATILDDYVTDLTACDTYLNGIYVMLGDYIYNGLNTVYPDLIADNVKPTTNAMIQQYSWAQVVNSVRNLRPAASYQNLNSLYTSAYRVIRQCNYLLENVDNFRSESPEKADFIKGQAYAIRGLMHHQLVLNFAQPYNFTADASHPGVPYVTTSDYTDAIIRQSVADVYSSIISDYNKGIELLAVASLNKYYMNHNAVKALLARAYLCKGDFGAANSLAVDIANRVPLMSSVDFPARLFKKQDAESVPESIFYIPPSSISSYTTQFASYFYRLVTPSFLATTDIVTILRERPNDKRSTWVTPLGANWRITKFPANSYTGITDTTRAYCHPVIRSSEMVLIAAETFAKIGKEDSARIYLDMIRKRADITALGTTAGGSALLDSIYKERRKELAFEGFRMYDLLRTGNGVNRTEVTGSVGKVLPYPSNYAIAPLPFDESNLTGMLQNLGY